MITKIKKVITFIQCMRFGINVEKGMSIHPFCRIISASGGGNFRSGCFSSQCS